MRTGFTTGLLILFFTFYFTGAIAQQPGSSSSHQLYLLSITPKKGGKSYTLFHKTKVEVKLTNQNTITGKVKGVSQDSISIDFQSYAVKDIEELKFNPGTPLGAVAAVAAAIGVAMIAFTVDGGKDGEWSDSEQAIFFGGVGLAVAGGVTLIPTYFVKKKFNSTEYDFTPVVVAY